MYFMTLYAPYNTPAVTAPTKETVAILDDTGESSGILLKVAKINVKAVFAKALTLDAVIAAAVVMYPHVALAMALTSIDCIMK